jgi:hypothetical protein
VLAVVPTAEPVFTSVPATVAPKVRLPAPVTVQVQVIAVEFVPPAMV